MSTKLIIKGADFKNNKLPVTVEIENLVAGLLNTNGRIDSSTTRLACKDYFDFAATSVVNVDIDLTKYKWNIVFYDVNKETINSSFPPVWITNSKSINDALLLPESGAAYFRIGFGKNDDTQLTVEEGTGKFKLIY